MKKTLGLLLLSAAGLSGQPAVRAFKLQEAEALALKKQPPILA
jgi:hypothetical protein